MWVLCFSYLVVNGVRTATVDWAQLYLIQELNHTHIIGELTFLFILLDNHIITVSGIKCVFKQDFPMFGLELNKYKYR